MGIRNLNYSLYLCVSFSCSPLRQKYWGNMHVPTRCSSLLTHSFYFWHMHAHSSHLFVYSCWIINFWAGCCDSNTHAHTLTHTLTRTWDWINTPLCSAEGGIDIIPGLKPNRLLSVRKREGGKDGGREGRMEGGRKGHASEERKRGTACSQVTCLPCIVRVLHSLTSTPWTLSFMWSSRVVFPSFLFFQQ